MGIEFRSGGYVRHVLMGGRTIKDGEAAAIWNVNGVHKQIIGPRRVYMYNSTIRFLTRHKAESHQYIRISHRDGRVEHKYGPAVLYQNPALHDSVSVHDGIRLLSENECIVVYNDSKSSADRNSVPKEVEIATPIEEIADTESESGPKCHGEKQRRKVIKGPTLFLPALGETVREFEWSGRDSDGAFTQSQNIFKILKTDPNRVLSLSLSVTTADSAQFTANMSFQYHMNSLDKCLDSMDPMQKMYDGMLADARSFGDTVTSDQLRAGEQVAVMDRLVSLETYPLLCQAAKAAGFVIDSARLTGLSYCATLQRQANDEQHNAARLRSELAGKKQRREILELEAEERRLKIEQDAELEQRQAEIRAKLEEESHELKEAALERKLALNKREIEAKREAMKGEDAATIQFLTALNNMGVDMTAFMCTAGGMKVASSVLSQAASLQKGKRKEEHTIKGEINVPKIKAEGNSVDIAWSST
mmetsp:Transcript_26220/g.38359  ORF Transcript_26220/g.38359 Transcript_26220/m.38359 type:complete len:475 (+) Transcript_26220:45-1469(+)